MLPRLYISEGIQPLEWGGQKWNLFDFVDPQVTRGRRVWTVSYTHLKVPDGISLHGHRGLHQVYPVEYKKGSPKAGNADILQLTAQALCLEEMFCAEVKEGAIFYGETRRRENILFTDELKEKVKDCFCQMHQLYDKRYTPKVKWSKSCNACSLKDICLPKLGKTPNVKEYIHTAITEDCQ